jgi:hypothetical protein
MTEDGAIVAAGFVADGASEPAFADAGWADEGEIVVGVAVRRLSRRHEVSLSRSRASQSACGKSFAWPAAARSVKALAIPHRSSVCS